jgi:glyoxylate/hydroxypyruvate reductase A
MMTATSANPPIPFIASAGYANSSHWIAALQLAMPHERIIAFSELSQQQKQQCRLAIVANPDPAELRSLPQLLWLHSVWAGVERLLTDVGSSNLKIVRLVDPQLAATMAEAVLAWVLYLHRDMPAYARQQRQNQWQPREYVAPQHKTVSLLGLGALGEAAAQRLLAAGFKVCGWSRNQKNLENIDCYAGIAELPQMLAKTDILVCLLPLTTDTTNLINADMLAALPKGAALINFARGAVIDDAALLAALDSQKLSHAVLDVFRQEPLAAEHAYWQHPQVTVLPHISAPTDMSTASAIVAANILEYRNSGQLPPIVDAMRGY